MNSEVVFEIARYAVNADKEVLLERLQLITQDGALFQSAPDGTKRACEGSDSTAVVAKDADLNEVRANQVTRIAGSRSLMEQLPLLLTLPGDAADADEWSDAMLDKHIAQSTADKDMYRVAYIGDERWYAYETVDGLKMLPENTSIAWQGEPAMKRIIGHLSFSEEGSMTSGTDMSTLGLITETVVAAFTHLDSYTDSLKIWSRDDDADTLVGWIMNGDIASHYSYGRDDDGAAMLAQLVVEAGLSEDKGVSIQGDALAAGVTQYGDTMGSSPTGRWRLSLGVDNPTIELALDRISETSSRLADIVTAGLRPESAQGRARAAALQELEGSDL